MICESGRKSRFEGWMESRVRRWAAHLRHRPRVGNPGGAGQNWGGKGS